MKHLLILPLAALMLIPMTPSAEAHPAPYAHRHGAYKAPRKAKVRRVVRRRAVRRPVHVVVRPAPVVVERAPVVVKRRKRRVVVEDPSPASLGLSLRALGSTVAGDKLGVSDIENPIMGGLGLALRSRFDQNFGLELSIDAIGGGENDFSQTTVPLMASVTYHFLPDSRLQPYVLAGLGVHFTRLEYLGGRYVHDLVEAAGQLGAGIEVFLSRSLSLYADLRGQTVFKNVDSQAKIREDCLHNIGSQTGFCNGISTATADDKVDLGLNFMVGASLYF